MTFLGCFAIPTNQPVVGRFQYQLDHPSKDDDKFGVMVSTDVVRANSDVLSSFAVAGAYEIDSERVTLSKDTYVSMLGDGDSERFARREKTLEISVSELQSRVLDLELSNAAQTIEIAALRDENTALKMKVSTLESKIDELGSKFQSMMVELKHQRK